MQRPQPETVTLDDILITQELSRRSPRSPNLQVENQALHTLARQLVNQPEIMLQTLVDIALELCNAGSAGVSLLEVLPSGEEIFRWNVLAGILEEYVGGTTPRNFSPCGTCLDRGSPQLYSHPERYFIYSQATNTPLVEGLVLPLIAENHALGTIWIVSHDEQRHFNSEDVRVMTSLADFTAAALLRNQQQTRELLAANAALEAEIAERKQAQERLRALIENLPVGAAFVVDRNLRYLLAEGEALSAAGFKSEDFVGKTIFEVLPPELATYYEVLYRKGLAGESFEHEHDAHDRSYVSRGTPLRLPNGEVYAVLAVSYDISDRKQAEAEIRRLSERNRHILESITDAFAVLDHEWRYTYINDRGAQILGSTPEQLQGTTIWEGLPGHEKTPFGQLYLQVAQTKVAGAIEAYFPPFDAWYNVRVYPTENGITIFNLDVSDRKRAEAALRESEEKYRTLFNSMEEGFCCIEVLYDADGQPFDHRIKEANPAFEKHTGLTNATGRLASELMPTVEQSWNDLYSQVIATGKSERLEQHSPVFDRWFDVEVSRVGDASLRRVAVMFRDITDGKRAEVALRESEARQAFLLRLSDVLRSLADPVEIQEAVTQTAMNYFGADRCYYCEIEDDSAIIRRDAAREDLPSVAGVYPLSRFAIFKAVVDAGRPFIVHNVHTTDRLDEDLRQLCIQLQVISFVDVPVIKNGKPVGILCLVQSTPRDWTDLEVELATETTDRTWAAVERARAGRALRESEEKYRSLFNLIDEGFCIFELLFDGAGNAVDWIYTEANPAFEQQTGYINPIGQRISHFQPDLERSWFERFAEVARTGEPVRFVQYTEAMGIWYDVYALRVGASGDNRVSLLFTDITDRKQAEAALRESEEQLRLFVTASSDIVYKMSADWSEMRRLEGKDFLASTENPSGTWIEQYIPTEDQPEVMVAIQAAIRTKSTFELEHRVIQLDGTVGWAFSRAMPFLDERGEIGEWFGAASDITDRKRAEAERIQLIQEQAAREEERQRAESLAALDSAKTIFFSNVSHEFRTPVTLLLAPLQDALSDRANPLPQEQRERLELAHRNAIRLLKLVNTLLDFSRIEAGRMEAVYEATDLALLTTELASVFRSAIERAGLRLIVDCPPLPEPVYVDREMWEKIVLNLLSNAFKFTLEGEISVKLHPADDHHVTLQVQDTGTGIPSEELPHLFERFYQVRGVKARTHEGSGIGLALVHELIRLHGGTVDVSSTVGQGTCFTVTIPLGTVHLPNVRLRRVVGESPTETLREHVTATRTQASTAVGTAPYVEEAERWLPTEAGEQGSQRRAGVPHASPLKSGNPPTRLAPVEATGVSRGAGENKEFLSSAPLPRTSASSARVLLVDDNADMRDYLTRILSEHVQVEAVAEGAAALATLQERVPDLILSDVMMPGLDGFELLKALRADARTREVPIILLSARAGEESVVEGLQAGADDYLIKPFSATELVTRVLAHLQMAHLRLEALRQERTTSRRKDEMLSIVSHELNTPLVAILGWTRLLRTSPFNQSMLMKSLETIERNATLQAKLISDLLDISRISAGKLRLNLEPVELQSVIEMAIACGRATLNATVNQSAQTKDIELEYMLNPLPTTVQGDPERLQQIVLNLLTNAIKFTPKGGRIEVRLNVIQNQAQIKVSDTGCGISAEFLPHVFESFRQAESSKSQSIKGLGLGLAIARHLVELHRGTIYVESPGIGQGATFTVTLPLIGANL